VKRSVANYPGLAGWVTGYHGGMGGQALGVRYADTYVVKTSGGTVWVIPGHTGACIAIPDGSSAGHSAGAHGGCGPLIKGRNTITGTASGFDGTDPTWYGIVPNSVKRVVVSYASGPKTTVPVTDNTFLVHLHGPMEQCFTRRTVSEEINLSTTATTLTAFCPTKSG
jgi:hypothetical protein